MPYTPLLSYPSMHWGCGRPNNSRSQPLGRGGDKSEQCCWLTRLKCAGLLTEPWVLGPGGPVSLQTHVKYCKVVFRHRAGGDNFILCSGRAIVWHLVQSEQQPGPAQAGAVGKGKNCRDGFIEVKTLPGTCNLTPFSNFQHLCTIYHISLRKKWFFTFSPNTLSC